MAFVMTSGGATTTLGPVPVTVPDEGTQRYRPPSWGAPITGAHMGNRRPGIHSVREATFLTVPPSYSGPVEPCRMMSCIAPPGS
jgi:hypothetical protein